MKTIRKGMGLGKGSGYYNLALMDSHIHSLSAKGVKTHSKSNKNYLKELRLYATGITEEHKVEATKVIVELKKQGKWEAFKEDARRKIDALKQRGYTTSQAIRKWVDEHNYLVGVTAGAGVALGIVAIGGGIGLAGFTVVSGTLTGEWLKKQQEKEEEMRKNETKE